MSDAFQSVEQVIANQQGNLGQRRITVFFRLIALLIIGMLVVVGLALNGVTAPWMFGLATVGGLVWMSHAIVTCTKQ